MVPGVWVDRQSVLLSTSRDSFASFESHPRRTKLMDSFEYPQLVGGVPDLYVESSPLGLTLRKTPSLLDMIEAKLSQQKKPPSTSTNQSNESEEAQNQTNDQAEREKWKASNFNAMLLRIGSWERVSMRDGDLVAKCYYSKRKLVWEILEGGLKRKLEVQFSDISAIRALFPSDEYDTLEIELAKPPIFYGEINPQPRKHTIWQASSDFTQGQARINRRHYVQFPKGNLWKHYERLLQCDERLFTLSKRHFPSDTSPYFHFDFGGHEDFSEVYQPQHNPRGSSFYQGQPFEHRLRQMTSMDLASPMSVMEFPPIEESGGSYSVGHQGTLFGKSIHMAMQNQVQEAPHFLPQRRSSQPSPQTSVLRDIADHLLYEPVPVACSDEQKLMARVNSMAFLLQLPNEQMPIGNASQNFHDNSSSSSMVSDMSNQSSYESGGFTFQEPEDWQRGLGSVNVQNPMMNLPRNSSFSYFLSNQFWDDS